MTNLYLYHSRKCARILRELFGIKSHWTNYTAWEYHFKGLNLEITYDGDREYIKRFNIMDYGYNNILLSTNSLKEVVNYLKSLK